MNAQDIRWVQRFSNYQRALRRLEQAVELATDRELSDLEKDGVIHAFKYTFQLVSTTLQDYLKEQSEEIHGPRDAFQLAFNRDIIENGQIWMDMIDSRKESIHTYNEDTAEKIYRKIVDIYFVEFMAFEKTILRVLG